MIINTPRKVDIFTLSIAEDDELMDVEDNRFEGTSDLDV